jgi:hypothetical protein
MITERQYLEKIAKENAEAIAKYFQNGGGVKRCEPDKKTRASRKALLLRKSGK